MGPRPTSASTRRPALVTEVASGLTPSPGEEVVDCHGLVVLDAPVEPHAHLDKAGTWDTAPNPDADLMSAVRTWATGLAHRSADEVLHTAWPVLEDLVLHGATAVRTHVNLDETTGWAPLEALVALRDDAARDGLAVVQIVALVSTPLSGEAGATHRRILDEALDRGADLAGARPTSTPIRRRPPTPSSPSQSATVSVSTSTPTRPSTPTPWARPPRGPGRRARVGHRRATASHCASLGQHGDEHQERWRPRSWRPACR